MRTRLGLILLIISGCSGTTGAPSIDGGAAGAGPSAALTPRDLFLRGLRERCALNARCGLIGRSEEAKCLSRGETFFDEYSRPLTRYDYAAAVAAGRIAIDGAAAERCWSTVASTSCARLAGTSVADAPECLRPFRGLVERGGLCTNTVECADGYCLFSGPYDPTATFCRGICVAYSSDTGSCAPPTGACDPARAWCDGIVEGYNCHPLGGVGATCRTHVPQSGCQEGLGCTAAQICANPGKGGEPCASGLCASGFHCAQGLCTVDARHGEPCGDPLACPDGDRCVQRAGDAFGTCMRTLDVGEACTPEASACPDSAPCAADTRTCTAPRLVAEGDACPAQGCSEKSKVWSELPSLLLHCDAATHTCKRKLKEGETCIGAPTSSADPCFGTCSVKTGTGVCRPSVDCF